MEKQKPIRPIIGGIFGTRTEWDENGNLVEQDEFHLRIYWDFWYTGAIKRLKGNMLHVYLTIAMHFNKSGEGWPTQERIAELCGINRDTVGAAIKKLVQEGFIEAEKIRGEDGKFKKTVYRIKFAPQPNEDDHAEKSDMDHAEKSGMEETPKNKGFDHAEKSDMAAMRKKPSRKNRHGKSDSKKDIFSKEEPSFKEEPIKQQQPEKPESAGSSPQSFDESEIVVVVEMIQYAWKQTFEEEIDQAKVRLLLKDAGQDGIKVIEAIKKVKRLNPDIPIAAVRYELLYGWDLDQPQTPKKEESKKPKLVSKLPMALRIEQPTEPTMADPSDQARIQAKMKLMDEILAPRKQGPEQVWPDEG